MDKLEAYLEALREEAASAPPPHPTLPAMSPKMMAMLKAAIGDAQRRDRVNERFGLLGRDGMLYQVEPYRYEPHRGLMLVRPPEPFVVTTIDPGPAPLEFTVVSSEHPKRELAQPWRLVQHPRLVELYPERRLNRRGRSKKHQMRTRREREARSCHPYVTATRSGR